MTEPQLLPGAEPLSASGGPTALLVIHGFTGSPQSMRPIAEAAAAAGHTVEMPRLPGHGTTVDDMLETDWDDWSSHVEEVYDELAARCDAIVVCGLSMGGALTLWLASRHPEIAGVVVINSAGKPDPEMAAGLRALADSGEVTMDAVGNDIAKPGVVEVAYDRTPVRPLISLLDAVNDLDLGAVTSPALVMVSEQDHVVPPETADHLAANLGGPVEVIRLADSYHVATLDHDAELIIERTLAFVDEVAG